MEYRRTADPDIFSRFEADTHGAVEEIIAGCNLAASALCAIEANLGRQSTVTNRLAPTTVRAVRLKS